MRAIGLLRLLGFLGGAAIVQAGTPSDFYLRDGDRVVFYGDSITEQQLYTTFVETYVATRFPKLDVTFFTSGWGGDQVTGGRGGNIDLRLRRDVFAHRPTVMTIMLGMNDAGYRAFDHVIFDTYRQGYEHILESVKRNAPGIRLTLIQPSPYDDVTRPPDVGRGYNRVLVRYGKFVRQLAERQAVTVADFNTSVVAVLKKAKDTDAELSTRIIPDRIHPGVAGQLLMAEALLKSWNAPGLVTAVEIDGGQGRVVRAEATKVRGVKDGNGFWRWTQEDAALPMPVEMRDPVLTLAVASSDFVQALNQQPLKVTGLRAERYRLLIDLIDVGVFTKEQLAEGINLAMLPTPMAKQAHVVHEQTLRRSTTHWTRWRTVEVPLAKSRNPKVQKALPEVLAGLEEEEEEVVKHERATAQPKIRRYILAPE